MKKSTRFFALCLALTMCATLAMTGALGETPQTTEETTAPVETTAAPADATAVPPTPAPDTVMATVNGDPVTYAKQSEIYNSLYYQYSSQGYNLTGQESILQSIAMEYAIQEVIFRQKAVELGVDQFSPEEEAELLGDAQETWDGYLEQLSASFLTSEAPTEEEKAAARKQAEDYMAQLGYTAEKALGELVANYKDGKIQERMVDLLTKDVPALTDEEVLAEYQSRVDADKETFGSDVSNYEYMTQYNGQKAWFVPEGMRGITHILLAVDSTLMDNYKAIQAQLEEQNDEKEEVTEPTEEGAAETTPEATAEVTPDPAATETPLPVTQADLDAARTAILDSIKDKTDAIYTRLGAGESFAALVAEFGTDPGMTAEPNKTDGYSVHKDSIMYDPAFVAGAFAPEMQKAGDFSQPVVSSFGVHILNYVRDIPGGPVELTEELKASIRTEMEQDRKSGALPKAMEEWIEAAQIIYTQQAAAEAPAEATETPAETPEVPNEDSAQPTEAPAETPTAAPSGN